MFESVLESLVGNAASSLQGIYRVNGVKTRVEKLCQAFENGKELVELSQCSPHDISNVLKLYLRQVPKYPIEGHCWVFKEERSIDAKLCLLVFEFCHCLNTRA